MHRHNRSDQPQEEQTARLFACYAPIDSIRSLWGVSSSISLMGGMHVCRLNLPLSISFSLSLSLYAADMTDRRNRLAGRLAISVGFALAGSGVSGLSVPFARLHARAGWGRGCWTMHSDRSMTDGPQRWGTHDHEDETATGEDEPQARTAAAPSQRCTVPRIHVAHSLTRISHDHRLSNRFRRSILLLLLLLQRHSTCVVVQRHGRLHLFPRSFCVSPSHMGVNQCRRAVVTVAPR